MSLKKKYKFCIHKILSITPGDRWQTSIPTLKQNDHIQKNCSATKDPRSTNEACMGKVELADILEEDVGEDNIFFLETSEKKTITPRESCGIESAARYAVHCIVY